MKMSLAALLRAIMPSRMRAKKRENRLEVTWLAAVIASWTLILADCINNNESRQREARRLVDPHKYPDTYM